MSPSVTATVSGLSQLCHAKVTTTVLSTEAVFCFVFIYVGQKSVYSVLLLVLVPN